jgi:hypothetical protein
MFAFGNLVTAMLATAALTGCTTEPEVAGSAPFVGKPDAVLPGVLRASGLSVKDLDADAAMDFAVLAGNAGTLSIFFGAKAPPETRRDRLTIEVGASASGFTLADFNEDRIDDIAVVQHDAGEIWIFLGVGNRSFGEPVRVQLTTAKPHAHRVTAADMNMDGHLDLVLAESDDNAVWVLLGDGKGGFEPSAGGPFPTANHPYVVATADFNGDRHTDVATPNWYGKSVSVLLGDGKGGFKTAPGSPLTGFTGPTSLAAGDLTGDGKIDLALGNDDSRVIQILVGDGRGAFTLGSVPGLQAPDECFAPTLADLNGDGRLDVIANAQNGARTLSYWINLGNSVFGPANTLSCPQSPSTICIADWNGDGSADLLVGTETGEKTLVWYGRR